MFDSIDWSDAAQVALFGTFVAGIIAAVGKAIVEIINAVNRNTAAVEAGNAEAAGANLIKVEQGQRNLEAAGVSPVTPATLPPAPRMADPAVREAAVKMLGTGDGGTISSSQEDTIRRIVEEVVSSMHTPTRVEPSRLPPAANE